MKTILLSVLILASGLIYSQKKIKVTESNEKFSVGNVNALIVSIYEADKDLVEKAWKKLLKKNGGKISNKSELIATDVLIKHMSDKKVDIYSKIEEESDKTVLLKVAVNLGGAYLSKSQHPERFKEFKKILYDFAVNISKEAVKEQIKDQEKVLSKLENDQDKLKKEKETLKKIIEDCKKKIKESEDAIVENEKRQQEKKKEIDEQKEVVKHLSEKCKAIQ